MRKSVTMLAAIPFLAAVLALPAFGQAGRTLNQCQQAAAKQTSNYVQQYVKAVGGCADTISKAVIERGSPIASAARKCQKGFRKLVSTSKPGSTLAAKLAAKVDQACTPPPAGKAEHTEADITGSSGSGEDIETLRLDAWCAGFGGDGSVDNLADWVSCLTAAGTCAARQELATAYPRLLEWLNALKPAIAALDPSCGGGCGGACTDEAVIDACSALEALEVAIDGATDDDLPEIACGPAREVPAAPLQTGQVTCSDTEGDEIPCAGTGQDGELQLGVARSYTFDSTVPTERTLIDNSTGLEWEVLCDEDPEGVALVCPTDRDIDTQYTWSQAFAKIAAMNAAHYGGHNDWRMPNVNELLTLVTHGGNIPTFDPTVFEPTCLSAPCAVSECSCSNFLYWSSTSYQANLAAFWAVIFLDGRVVPFPKEDAGGAPLRAVSGGLS